MTIAPAALIWQLLEASVSAAIIIGFFQFSHLLIKVKQRKKVRQRDKEVKLHIAVHQASCSSLLSATGQMV